MSDSERQLERERIQQIRQGVEAGREVLLTRLAELQPSPDATLAPTALAEVTLLVERIEQLDALIDAGETSLSQAATSQQLVKPLDAIERQLADDEQVLKLQARLISELVEQRTRDMQRAMGYLELTALLPEDEVRRLRTARGNLRGLLDQIAATRVSTRQAVTAEADRPVPSPEQSNVQHIQDRAAALLAPKRRSAEPPKNVDQTLRESNSSVAGTP